MDSSSPQVGLYIKAIGSLVVTGLTAYMTAASDGDITATDWLTIAIAVIAAFGIIWAIPATPRWLASYGKAVAAALIAGLTSIIVGLQDGLGLDQVEIIIAIIAFLTALGFVAAAPNAASSDPVDASGHVVPVSLETKQTLVSGPGNAAPPNPETGPTITGPGR